MHRRRALFAFLGALAAPSCAPAPSSASSSSAGGRGKQREPVELALSDADWRARLTRAQYDVLRRHGTEPPWSSPLEHEHRPGLYSCAGCTHPLFSSETKFESGTGWPSFWTALPDAVGTSVDYALIVPRTEVHCRRCGGHLGHVFNDGPKPTGLRYCINGVALSFRPRG